MIASHLNDRRRAFIEQTAGVMNGESHGIVIGMPAFVGMCEHEPRLNFKKSGVNRVSEFGQAKSGFLIGNVQPSQTVWGQAGQGGRGFSLAMPSASIGSERTEAVSARVMAIFRRTVGDENNFHWLQRGQLSAGANDFVIRMSNDHDDPGNSAGFQSGFGNLRDELLKSRTHAFHPRVRAAAEQPTAEPGPSTCADK